MARSAQWNVKGVDDETRAVARDAAAAAGLPIGAWIDRAVKRGAKQEPPAEPARDSVLPVGPAWEMPPDELALSTRRGSWGRGARIAITVAVMALFTVGAIWLLDERAQQIRIASQPEPTPTPAAIAPPPVAGVNAPETASQLDHAAAEADEKAPALAAIAPAASPAAPIPQLEEFTTANEAEAVPRATVIEIQKLLARLDLDPGPANGVIDEKTEAAIARYQAMAGLAEDGKPSATLLDDLRAVAGAATR